MTTDVAGPAATETHCATLFFTADRAYKLKKPIDLGFADFRTPESRHQACRREVELNRRFAPDVYLGVAAIGPDGGKPCDWAVVMRRMPAERRLSTLVADRQDVTGQLRDLARLLAVHHASARRSLEIDQAGTAEDLRRRWSSNLDGLKPFRQTVLDGGAIDEIAHLALTYVYGRRVLLAERVTAGRIRDGHGDLLADDVFCLDDGPRALDCLDFDDYLRSVDGLDDAACLAMDLERLGATALGERFVGWYCEFRGETRVESLVHHYIAYRAVVRAKVACLRWAQGDGSAREPARRFAGIALRHLRLGEPRLILVGGTPGVGKSTVAAGLADRLGAVLLRSDRLRKELAGVVPARSAAAAWQEGIYRPAVTEDTYSHLIDTAGLLLRHGETVVLDAGWSTAGERARARAAASDAFAPVVELHCTAPVVVVDERIRRRAAGPDPSDATVEIARLMEREFEPWPEAAPLPTTGTVDVTLLRALTQCARTQDHVV
jgi:uncharacterized protein